MKELYSGYSKKDKQELKELWKDVLITFDANVILNLYRYSESTRTAILELIDKFKDQIFLTHQVGLEYNRNRYEIISDQENSHKDFLKKLKTIENDLKSKDTPPFLSDNLYKSMSSVFNKVEKEIQTHIDSFEEMIDNDKIFDKIDEIFKNKITKKFDEEKISEIYKEGNDRYEKKIPPGYEDNKKPVNRKFGDLVFWKEILEKSKTNKKSIILISDERKEDWIWKLRNGKTIGPRQELVEELKEYSGKSFHIYSTERFLNFGQTYLNENVNNKAILEIEKIKKSDLQFDVRKFEELAENAVVSSHKRIAQRIPEKYDKYLEQLSPREADFIRLNLGLGSFEAMNIKEMAETFDLTESRTNRIRNQAFGRLTRIINKDISEDER